MAKTKYKPLKDLNKESQRVQLTQTRDKLADRREGLDISVGKLRQHGLERAAAACEAAQNSLLCALDEVSAFIEKLEAEG